MSREPPNSDDDEAKEILLTPVSVDLSLRTLERIEAYQVRSKQRCPWLPMSQTDAIRSLISAALDADERSPT